MSFAAAQLNDYPQKVPAWGWWLSLEIARLESAAIYICVHTMKTSQAVVLSSLVTASILLAGAAVYVLFQQRQPQPQSDSASPVSSVPVAVNPTVQATPVAQVTPSAPAAPVITWTQSENDYLYDLSQALQPQERDRITAAGKLEIGHQIQGWLDAGADYWNVREKFDAAYKSAIVGDYAQNRDVYLKFATQRLAPAHLDTLTPPPKKVYLPSPAPRTGSDTRGNNGNSPFTGGNPIPQKTATVTASNYLNCRATPKDGAPVTRLQPGDTIEVNRIDYSTGTAWYLTTQGCWISGSYIQMGSANPKPGFRQAYTKRFGFYKDAPGGSDTTPYQAGEKIQVSKYPSQNGGVDWYQTSDNQWIDGNDIQ
jgi:hypothetical protein